MNTVDEKDSFSCRIKQTLTPSSYAHANHTWFNSKAAFCFTSSKKSQPISFFFCTYFLFLSLSLSASTQHNEDVKKKNYTPSIEAKLVFLLKPKQPLRILPPFYQIGSHDNSMQICQIFLFESPCKEILLMFLSVFLVSETAWHLLSVPYIQNNLHKRTIVVVLRAGLMLEKG